MKEMFITLNEARKEDPKEFYGGIAVMVFSFALTYVVLWILVNKNIITIITFAKISCYHLFIILIGQI